MSTVVSFKKILTIAQRARRSGKHVVSTNGCFDLLHIGHTRNLAKAKSLGDLLIVGVNSDTSVRTYKGKGRPIIPARERAEIIAGLKSVDYVFIFNEPNPVSWIKKLRPDIHVKGKGAPYAVEKESVETGGGKFVLLPFVPGHSTTRIVHKISGK